MTVRKPLLYYFTGSFPFGLGELWKLNEIEVLREGFERIRIVPFTFAGNRRPRPVPERCEVLSPLLDELGGLRGRLPWIFTGGRFVHYLKELLASGAYRRKTWLTAWAIASVEIEMAMRSAQIRQLLDESRGTVIYFFWAREWAYVAPFLKRAGFTKLFARFHNFDLYEERADNAGYIPYRGALIDNLAGAILLAAGARDYLETRHPAARGKTEVIPLGVRLGELAVGSDDGVLRIVSCSRAVALKRLDLILDALRLYDRPIHWTHVGDGPLLAELRARAASLPPNVQVEFVGSIEPAAVQPFYAGREFDLFLNVSEAEGVPVSIMEAMAAGIPVVATDVGGTSSLVSALVGTLLPPGPSPQQVSRALAEFQKLRAEQRAAMRAAARSVIEERFDASKNARILLSLLNRNADGRRGLQ